MDGITTASQWRSKKGLKALTLPSGVVIKVKDSSMFALALANLLPMELLQTVIKDDKSIEENGQKVNMVETMRKLVPMIKEVVVEPRIIMEGDPMDGEILFYDIPDEDLGVIIRYIMGAGEAAPLESFRKVESGNHSGQDGAAVRQEAV